MRTCAVSLLKRRAARVVHGRPDVKERVVALSFDDGPAEWTLPILATLRSFDVRATFFVIGDAIPGRETILLEEVANGHEIGNHSQRHSPLHLSESDDDVRREIDSASQAIAAVVGTRPRLFRPPGFGVSRRVRRVAARCGFEWIVQASVAIDDYAQVSPRTIAEAILGHNHLASGAIIDLHDGRPPHEPPPSSGGSTNDRWPTAAAVESIVSGLLGAGYSFVTVSELLDLPGSTREPRRRAR